MIKGKSSKSIFHFSKILCSEQLGNPLGRVEKTWNCEMPDFYELRDNCNILDSIPQGSDFYQITNSPCLEETNGGKTTVLHRGKSRLGPFIADSKIVVDYYKGNNYVAQSNWMSVQDQFMVIMPPPVNKTPSILF